MGPTSILPLYLLLTSMEGHSPGDSWPVGSASGGGQPCGSGRGKPRPGPEAALPTRLGIGCPPLRSSSPILPPTSRTISQIKSLHACPRFRPPSPGGPGPTGDARGGPKSGTSGRTPRTGSLGSEVARGWHDYGKWCCDRAWRLGKS